MGIFNRAFSHLHNRQRGVGQVLARGKHDSAWSILSTKLANYKEKILQESVLFIRNTILQIDYIATNRIRRVNTLTGLYSKLYERERLMEMMRHLLKNFRSRRNGLMLGATVFSVFDWDENKVSDNDLKTFSNDINFCQALTKRTLTCSSCGQRFRIEKEVESVQYCQCKDAPKSVWGVGKEQGDWSPFLERKDIIVWRREHPTMKGMYVYRMYGRFDDVSAEEFIRVQLDMSEFRLSWDTSTAQCYVLDSNKQTDQEVYYWEVNWPRFFSNRDYCCVRQSYTDVETGSTVLISRSTDHPNCPVKRKCLRVSDYDSVLTVQPFDKPDQLGMEFSLTGFENPGVQLPEAIITYVAIRGMPEFMQNLRAACIKMRKHEPAAATPCAVQANTNRNEEAGYSMKNSQIYA